jgi:hypothetical protein
MTDSTLMIALVMNDSFRCRRMISSVCEVVA